jgi:NRPS condensation-like uncharacterized protein
MRRCTMEEVWYKLDNAAKIYPAITKAGWAPVFRVDAVLREEIDSSALQSSLLMTYKRFPSFSVRIAKGLFWYYFEGTEAEPVVMKEDDYPLRPFSQERDRGYLFRVLYYRYRISLEVFHSISDGFGAIVFLKTLVFNYLKIVKGEEMDSDLQSLERYGILYYRDLPVPEETEDSFLHFASKDAPLKFSESPAFKIPGTRLRKNTIHIAGILLNTNQFKALSKTFDCSVTELLTSIFIHSIINARVYRAAEKKPIKISVPVNLRRFFPSITMRNFSSYINVEVFPEKNATDTPFKDICASVRKQMREGLDADALRAKFSSNVMAERLIVMRAAPLFLKNLVLKYSFSFFGERLATSTVSNMGIVELPKAMSSMVERFDFINSAPMHDAMNCGVISFSNTTSVSFTCSISENCILKKFVGFLVEHDIETRLETNY